MGCSLFFFFLCYMPGCVCVCLTPPAPFQDVPRCCLLSPAAARLPALPGRWSILIAFQRRWLGPPPPSPRKCRSFPHNSHCQGKRVGFGGGHATHRCASEGAEGHGDGQRARLVDLLAKWPSAPFSRQVNLLQVSQRKARRGWPQPPAARRAARRRRGGDTCRPFPTISRG